MVAGAQEEIRTLRSICVQQATSRYNNYMKTAIWLAVKTVIAIVLAVLPGNVLGQVTDGWVGVTYLIAGAAMWYVIITLLFALKGKGRLLRQRRRFKYELAISLVLLLIANGVLYLVFDGAEWSVLRDFDLWMQLVG